MSYINESIIYTIIPSDFAAPRVKTTVNCNIDWIKSTTV